MPAHFESQVPRYQARVNAALARWLEHPNETPQQLLAAMRYAVLGPGKRIRPLLCYATAELLELDPGKVDPIAVAIEFVHAYSLIHDDLPSMDDDDLRRGRATTHRAFDEATAILAGDALQALAFQVLIDDPLLQADYPEHQAGLVGLLASAAGPAGMVGGQVLDLAAEGRNLTAAELEDLHRRKTGRLIEAAILMPAKLCPARNEADALQLRSFATLIGLAFQIRDDILEVEEDTATLGKSADSDTANAKSTYPSVLGLERAKHRADELYAQAVAALDGLGANGVGLRWLCDYIVQRHH